MEFWDATDIFRTFLRTKNTETLKIMQEALISEILRRILAEIELEFYFKILRVVFASGADYREWHEIFWPTFFSLFARRALSDALYFLSKIFANLRKNRPERSILGCFETDIKSSTTSISKRKILLESTDFTLW